MATPAPARTPLAPPSKAVGPAMWATAAAVMLIVFSCQFALALRLNTHGDLTMLNRYFDADNAWYLVNFETGNQSYGSWGGRNVVHPNVANFIHPVVWSVSKLVSLFDHRPSAQVVQHVSFAVGPAFAGIRSGLLFAALLTAGFALTDALLGTMLVSVAFSSVMFGCLPESFVLSSACFAFYFLVLAQTALRNTVPWRLWLLAGTLLSSVTITNIVPFALGLFLLLFLTIKPAQAVPGQALKNTLRLSAAALAATALCFLLLTAAHGTFKGVGRRVGQLREVRFSARSLLIDIPKTIARSLVAVPPNQLTGTDEEHKSDKVQIVRFTFRDDLDDIKRATDTIHSYHRFVTGGTLEWSVFALIVLGVALSSRVVWEGTNVVKLIFLVSLTHLAFHWLLHSFFGLELFLYSQHWLVPLVIAVCCGCTLSRPYRWLTRSVVVILIAASVVQTFSVMSLLTKL